MRQSLDCQRADLSASHLERVDHFGIHTGNVQVNVNHNLIVVYPMESGLGKQVRELERSLIIEAGDRLNSLIDRASSVQNRVVCEESAKGVGIAQMVTAKK